MRVLRSHPNITLAIPLLVFSLAVSVDAQISQYLRQSIWVGMPLQLGMSRDAIISKLNERYSVTKIESDADDDWIVTDKTNPTIWEGHLGFRDGKLTYASRSWAQGEEDAFAFAEALWGALTQMERDGEHSCSFDVPTVRSPIAEIHWVRFYCGAKKIEIMMTNVFNGKGKEQQVSITEVLSSETY